MNYHRDVMNKTVQWHTAFILAVTGGIVSLKPDYLKSYGLGVFILLGLIVAIFTCFSGIIRLTYHGA